VLAGLFAFAGALHLLAPEPFLDITPSWVPFPEEVIRFTGVAELLGAAGLLIPRLRKAAGWGLALYALCVWPANMKHAFDELEPGRGLPLSWIYHGPRLLLQPVIIWWCLWAGGVTNWPFRGRKPGVQPPG
jgi:uncharacterized membrane protein